MPKLDVSEQTQPGWQLGGQRQNELYFQLCFGGALPFMVVGSLAWKPTKLMNLMPDPQ